MDFERKENAEGYDICLPCEYTCSGFILSYEVRKFITSAEHVRIYMEVTRYELERQNTPFKVAVKSSKLLPSKYTCIKYIYTYTHK